MECTVSWRPLIRHTGGGTERQLNCVRTWWGRALKQKLQLLRWEIAAEPANAGDVSARLVEDRIGAEREHDWDRRSRRFGGNDRWSAADSDDHVDAPGDQRPPGAGSRSFSPSAQRKAIRRCPRLLRSTPITAWCYSAANDRNVSSPPTITTELGTLYDGCGAANEAFSSILNGFAASFTTPVRPLEDRLAHHKHRYRVSA